MIRDLSRRFPIVASVLPMQVPLLAFILARSRLPLEEIASTPATAPRAPSRSVIINGNSSGASADRAPPASPCDHGWSSGDGSSGGGHGGCPQQQQQGGQTPWMGYFAPWSAPFPPWFPLNVAGLRPRPGTHAQAYPVFYPAPQSTSYAPPQPPSTQSRDQANKLNASMSNLSLHQLDTGASSHISENTGKLTKIYYVSVWHLPHIMVGNGSSLPVSHVGYTHVPP